jgi:acetolactate synthase-1/2/3 large subunit
VDRAPLIVMTASHPGEIPACKASLDVTAESAAHWIAHAARLTMSEPRGPVHLDLAADLARRSAVPLATSCRPDPLPYPDAAELDAAARALAHASRPLLLAGLHCRSAAAAQWLRALAEALPAPVLATARAKGALPDPHPLMMGALGGAGLEDRLLGRADLVVAIGLDAHEPVPAACWSTRPVLALGPPQALDDRPLAARVLGAVGVIIEELAERLRDEPRADWDVAELDRLRRAGATLSLADGLTARVVRRAREATEAGTIAAVDAGAHHASVVAAWAAAAPMEFLSSNGPSSVGFALPAALAAQLAHPARRVLCFTDAGGLAAQARELETAARLGASVVVITFGAGPASTPSPLELAKSSGVPAVGADTEERFVVALGQALRERGPALIAV